MGVGLAIGAGVAALAAGGAMGYGMSQSPNYPSVAELLGKSGSSLYGGLGYEDQIKLARLMGIPEEERTDSQQKKIDSLTALKEKPGLMDRILEAQGEFLTEFDKVQLNRYSEAAPQVAQMQSDIYKNYGIPMAQQAYQSQQEMSPEFFNLRNQLAQQLGGDLGGGLNNTQLEFFRNQARAAQASKGIMESPLGSTQEALYLTELNMAQQQQNTMNAMNFINTFRLPNAYPMPNLGIESTMGAIGQGPQGFQPPAFGEVAGLTSGLSAAQIAAQQAQVNQTSQGISSIGGMLGGVISGMGGGGGSMMGLMGGSTSGYGSAMFNPQYGNVNGGGPGTGYAAGHSV